MIKIQQAKYLFFLTFILLTASTPLYGYPNTQNNEELAHLLNRISFGARPGEIENLRKTGIDNYIQQQLNPQQISIPSTLKVKLEQLPTLSLSTFDLSEKYGLTRGKNKTPAQRKEARQKSQMVLNQAIQARLLRAIESPHQLEEVMVDFWFNHFNVFANKGQTTLWTGTYERDAIRPHVFGKFRNLLEATARHPAMLLYLDNWQNTAPNSSGARGRFKGINENYARELMELHTLGVDGGYKQQDVEALALILTGWGFNQKGFYFNRQRHDFSDKIFLGTTIKGSGEKEVEQALDILAKNPKTARHISYKLAQYFVSDIPPDSLVNRLQQRFLETNGNIKMVLESLLKSPEFWDKQNYHVKFKTPYQYVVSAVRVTGMDVQNPQPLQAILTQMGMPIYGCLTPDGYKNTETAWLNPEAMTRRLNFATTLGTRKINQFSSKKVAMGTLAKTKNIPDADQLMATLRYTFSPKTLETVRKSPVNLRSALVLGSPEFMRR